MKAAEVISEIKKLPRLQKREVYQFVEEQSRREEARRDKKPAIRELMAPGENTTWAEARRLLGWS